MLDDVATNCARLGHDFAARWRRRRPCDSPRTRV